MTRSVFIPVLPWEVASAVMTAMAVYGFEVWGAEIIGVFALALGVYQLLLRALLEGQAHSEEIERRTDQLDVRHEAMLGLLLETLALRDPSPARHAAAVAHYAHELAHAAGLSEREQAIVHTAGLLHDLGKEALPDHILIGRSELHPAELRLIERHPADGARLLLRVEGMGEVAAAVLAHHERIDGRGYPDGLSGDSIPMTARILAVAEVYDVMTVAGLLPDPAAAPPKPRTSYATSPARSSTAGSCGCSPPRSCAAATATTSGTSPTSRPSCRSSAASAACSTARSCSGPYTMSSALHPADREPPRQQPEADQEREVAEVHQPSKPNTASRTSSTGGRAG